MNAPTPEEEHTKQQLRGLQKALERTIPPPKTATATIAEAKQRKASRR